MRRLFIDDELRAGPLHLSGDEARHAATVLRARAGDTYLLMNGRGQQQEAQLQTVEKKSLQFTCAEPIQMAHHIEEAVHVFSAAPKGSRFDDMFRSLCELGVGGVGILTSEHSERHNVKANRLERIANEALKQSMRPYLPSFLGERALAEILAEHAESDVQLLCLDPRGEAMSFPPRPDDAVLAGSGLVPCRCLVLIGPEGGFSEAEREQCLAAGARPLRLSSAVLRIETAAIAAVGACVASWQQGVE